MRSILAVLPERPPSSRGTGRKAVPSYTLSMKTAVSLPEDVFAGAERLAKRLKKSRSRLYSDAIAEYLARHDPDAVTEKLNEVLTDEEGIDPFVDAATRRLLERNAW
jgi:predicted transcriptional regulator